MCTRKIALMGAAVAAFILVGDSMSIRCGLWLDDYGHYTQLRNSDWSYRAAVDAARLGVVGDVIDLWSRHESGLRFYRPIAFWIMRAEYTLVNWDPVGMHIFSLLWHWCCAMLVGLVAWRLIGHWGWAGVAACLMAIHPGHVVTVYWIACQTELFVTLFMLSATLCYAHYAGWWHRPAPLAASATDQPTQASVEPHAASAGWLIASLVLFALAMGCREHAIMWPCIILIGDIAFRRHWMHHLPAYVGSVALVGLYFVLRQEALGGFPLPGHPYLTRPGDPGFFRFIFDKLVYYTVGLFGFTPVVPIGWRSFFADRPLSFYGGFAGVCIGILVLSRVWPRRRELLLPVAWMVVFLLPLLPVIASCHHLYLPSCGMAWLFAIGLSLAGAKPTFSRRGVAVIVTALHAIGLTLATFWFGWTYRTATSVEDLVLRDVLEAGPSLKDGDHLFFINMPMYAYYAVPAIEAATGAKHLEGHVLTFSPWLLHMLEPGTVKRVDDHTLVVTAPPGEDNGYFAGVTGRMLLTVMSIPDTLHTGDRIDGRLFDVLVEDADEKGVRRLRFTFERPLDSPDYHFYFGSPVRWAYPLRW